jgi:hypothetical protein
VNNLRGAARGDRLVSAAATAYACLQQARRSLISIGPDQQTVRQLHTMASPNAKEGYEPGEIQEKPVPKFHMAVDSEYKVCTHAVPVISGWHC